MPIVTSKNPLPERDTKNYFMNRLKWHHATATIPTPGNRRKSGKRQHPWVPNPTKLQNELFTVEN